MGPNERELLKVLNASYTAVTNAHKAWENGRSALDTVKAELKNGIDGLDEELGGKTRRAAIAKFNGMQTRVEEHQASLVLGRDALSIAATAIDKAQKDYNSLPGIIPEPEKLPADADDADTIVYAKRQANASRSVADRETAAGTALTSLNTSLDTSITKMREARGDAPPDDTSGGTGGTTTKTSTYTGYTGGQHIGTSFDNHQGDDTGCVGVDYPTDPTHRDPDDPHYPTDPHDPYDPNHPHVPTHQYPPYDPYDPNGPGDGSYDPNGPGSGFDDDSLVPGGLTTGLTSGLIGTTGLVSGIRGLTGLRGLTTGLTSGQVSGTGRMAGGMIGRSGAVGGAGGRAGSRVGGRGGRGAGGSMGGRDGSKRKGKKKGKATDHLVEEDAWLDDEGTGPEVLN